ncbi:MAG: hypothetical protein BWK79_15075 [Beggiatoa sp. IS2]|nr:MAG: hypothetical protein BWK79_15075 [Beggiatoa sp. IS2]
MSKAPISEEFIIAGPAGKLEVRVSSPQSANNTPIPYIVVCHPHPLYGGTLDNKVVYTIASTFNQLGVGSVRFNFRGIGKSSGHFDYGKGEVDDLQTVVTWLNTQQTIQELWLAGYSFGGYVALRAHRHLNAQRLLLVAPAIEQVDFAELQLSAIPTLIIQGNQDEVISPQSVATWVAKQPHQPSLQWVQSADHFFHRQLNELREIILREW